MTGVGGEQMNRRIVHPSPNCTRTLFMTRTGAYVYILASKRHGTLYIGVMNDIARRLLEHREGKTPGFTSKYDVNRLVYLERYETMPEAIVREKAMKQWQRAWKVRLIEQDNPLWDDLAEPYFGLPKTPERARRAPMPHPD